MRTSFHHQPEAQHPNFQLSVSSPADYPIFWRTRQFKVPGREKQRRLHHLPSPGVPAGPQFPRMGQIQTLV